ncbi:hypothetical protein KEM48_005726 [Puccinia striiformis f. sp. tritici PST-130]|nr:hypothetical protein KEM48_005726 [Puccinia striiformis f. sp. tritici PST-130]
MDPDTWIGRTNHVYNSGLHAPWKTRQFLPTRSSQPSVMLRLEIFTITSCLLLFMNVGRFSAMEPSEESHRLAGIKLRDVSTPELQGEGLPSLPSDFAVDQTVPEKSIQEGQLLDKEAMYESLEQRRCWRSPEEGSLEAGSSSLSPESIRQRKTADHSDSGKSPCSTSGKSDVGQSAKGSTLLPMRIFPCGHVSRQVRLENGFDASKTCPVCPTHRPQQPPPIINPRQIARLGEIQPAERAAFRRNVQRRPYAISEGRFMALLFLGTIITYLIFIEIMLYMY